MHNASDEELLRIKRANSAKIASEQAIRIAASGVASAIIAFVVHNRVNATPIIKRDDGLSPLAAFTKMFTAEFSENPAEVKEYPFRTSLQKKIIEGISLEAENLLALHVFGHGDAFSKLASMVGATAALTVLEGERIEALKLILKLRT